MYLKSDALAWGQGNRNGKKRKIRRAGVSARTHAHTNTRTHKHTHTQTHAHTNTYTHTRDLKLDNIMLENADGANGVPSVRIIDFGMGEFVTNGAKLRMQCGERPFFSFLFLSIPKYPLSPHVPRRPGVRGPRDMDEHTPVAKKKGEKKKRPAYPSTLPQTSQAPRRSRPQRYG